LESSTLDGKKAEQVEVEAPQNGDRVYGLDAARAVLMIAGIPYHAALPFSDGNWLIELQSVPLLGWLSWAIHLVRMPTFFFISGILSAIVVSRRGKSSWIKNRNSRLGYPLLFGVFVLNYGQFILLKTRVNHEYAQAVYFSFPGHFWFIIVLLMLSYLYYLTH
jgi:glucan biosynthesis protein C